MARRGRGGPTAPYQNDPITTDREIWGFYLYGLAAEVFAVCGVGSFLPVTLEQLAREKGVLLSDRVTPCVSPPTTESTASHLVKRENAQCIVSILGMDVNTSSFALYTFSLGVLTQVIVLISMSAIADYGGYRKRLLLTLGWTGAAACMLFLFVSPGIYLAGSLLVMVTIPCLGNSFVLLNSFLPLLVTNHPSIRNKSAAEDQLESFSLNDVDDDSDDSEVLSPPTSTGNAQRTPYTKAFKSVSAELKLSNQISSKAIGIGYAASVFVQFISIGIIWTYSKVSPALSKTTVPTRTVLFVVGLWWAVWTVPTARWLLPRPGPPLPTVSAARSRWLSVISYIIFAWRSLGKTVRLALQLRQVVLFLVAWFILSDAIATISGTAILFARTELQMETTAIAILSVVATAAGFIGATSWPHIARRFGLDSRMVMILCIAFYEFIPLYGLLGFVPFIKAWGVGGLQQQWEIFPLGFLLGFVMGGLSSYTRAFYGALIPPGREAAFYALYAVTDKGSSVIGPAIVGRIIDATGSIRMAFWFLSVLFLLPGPILWFVDVEQGKIDAVRLAESKEEYGAVNGDEEGLEQETLLTGRE